MGRAVSTASMPWPREVSGPLTPPERPFPQNNVSDMKLVVLNLHLVL